MSQKQYVAKPEKVIAEQYLEGMSPDPAGLHRCGLSPLVETGPPHVHANGQVYPVQSTDWIITDKWTNQPTGVLTDAQFQDKFGSGGGPNAAPQEDA